MGGIQRISSLPDGPNFSQTDNKYDKASYERIYAEFGLDPSADFRNLFGQNHGLDRLVQPREAGCGQPVCFVRDEELELPVRSLVVADVVQLVSGRICPALVGEPLVRRVGKRRGVLPLLLRIISGAGVDENITEAYVYCILGAQVNVCSSIVGGGGRSKEVQREFLVLLEDAIRTPDISKSVQRYQMAVDEAKVRLDLAVVPWAWLMPSRMILNTGSAVGYNNKLRQAGRGMKLCVNTDLNRGTKKSALHLMGGGPSKINLPNSHESNPIHKAAQAESEKTPEPKKVAEFPKAGANTARTTEPEPAPAEAENHDANKIILALGAVGLAGVLFWTLRKN